MPNVKSKFKVKQENGSLILTKRLTRPQNSRPLIMRLLCSIIFALALVLALPTSAFAMGSGPHPTVPYGIPLTPSHGGPVIAASAVSPAGGTAAAPSIWDHQIYVIALAIAAGELLLWGLMVAGKATRGNTEE